MRGLRRYQASATDGSACLGHGLQAKGDIYPEVLSCRCKTHGCQCERAGVGPSGLINPSPCP